MSELDARLLYDRPPSGGGVLFLGRVSQIGDAAAGLRSAIAEAKHRGGTNLRVEMLDQAGDLVYAAKVPS